MPFSFIKIKKKKIYGTLIVRVVDRFNNPVVGWDVYIHSGKSKFDSNIYCGVSKTDEYGKVIFVKLRSGTYYVDCFYEAPLGNIIYVEGYGNVSTGNETMITI